jgi:hypothetical protein
MLRLSVSTVAGHCSVKVDAMLMFKVIVSKLSCCCTIPACVCDAKWQ